MITCQRRMLQCNVFSKELFTENMWRGSGLECGNWLRTCMKTLMKRKTAFTHLFYEAKWIANLSILRLLMKKNGEWILEVY